MQYFLLFLEGVITFISPCLLPMLPIYVSYFAGGRADARSGKRVVKNALGFILGFSVVFVLLGALAGLLGGFLREYRTAVNIVTGSIVIFFGLNFLGVFKLTIFRGSHGGAREDLGFFSALVFGVIFAIGWTPCVGAFLGTALMLAVNGASVLRGVVMLLFYSIGLGVPFFISALLIDKLKGAFSFIKRHYRIINTVSGCFLVTVGILMATGLFGRLLTLLS